MTRVRKAADFFLGEVSEGAKCRVVADEHSKLLFNRRKYHISLEYPGFEFGGKICMASIDALRDNMQVIEIVQLVCKAELAEFILILVLRTLCNHTREIAKKLRSSDIVLGVLGALGVLSSSLVSVLRVVGSSLLGFQLGYILLIIFLIVSAVSTSFSDPSLSYIFI